METVLAQPDIKNASQNGMDQLTYRELLKQEIFKCADNTRLTAKMLFPDLFTIDFSVIHDQILDAIDSEHKKIVIAAPRGIGKTTIARTFAAKAILFRQVQFIMYLSNSAGSAEEQTENIKYELLGNTRIQDYFGSIKDSDFDYAKDDRFSKLAWVAFGRTLVLPRGSGQQVRGRNWRGQRPQLIIVDDLEDREEVRNPEIRKAQREWFFSDLLKCVDQFKKDYKIVYIDTLKHPNSLLQGLLDSPDWHSVHLSLCDDKLHSYVPEYMSDKEIRIELDRHRRDGIPHVFYMEYMNIVTSAADAAFKSEYFQYYNESDQEFQEKLLSGDIVNLILVDPAKTVEMHSAYSAIVCWGVDIKNHQYYFRDVVAEKLYPDELYDQIYLMAKRYKAYPIGVEVTSLKEFIKQPLENYLRMRGLPYELIELTARRGTGEYADKNRGKEGRVAGLVPDYRQKHIWHNRAVSHTLEEQLLSFPRPKRWDVMDAAAYLIEMLEKGDRYFLPTEDQVYDIPKDEYAELEQMNEAPPKLDWRFYA